MPQKGHKWAPKITVVDEDEVKKSRQVPSLGGRATQPDTFRGTGNDRFNRSNQDSFSAIASKKRVGSLNPHEKRNSMTYSSRGA